MCSFLRLILGRFQVKFGPIRDIGGQCDGINMAEKAREVCPKRARWERQRTSVWAAPDVARRAAGSGTLAVVGSANVPGSPLSSAHSAGTPCDASLWGRRGRPAPALCIWMNNLSENPFLDATTGTAQREKPSRQKKGEEKVELPKTLLQIQNCAQGGT